MRNLPSRGRCHAAFLLAYSARVRRCEDVPAWLGAALEKPTHMAASLDLAGTAQLLQDAGLARVHDVVTIARDLARLDRVADLTTLKAIARLLLTRCPPDWLRNAVINDGLVPEFIPAADLAALSWLGSDLEPVIVAVHRRLYGTQDDALLKWLGDAGELMIMAGLQSIGLRPRHVALASDHFGYDIEFDRLGNVQGLEVKTVVPATSDRILLSRNEFDVSRRMADHWKVVQVTLSSQVIARGGVTTADLLHIRELSSASLSLMALPDSEHFKWTESAEFRPLAEMWRPSDLVVPPGFAFDLADG